MNTKEIAILQESCSLVNVFRLVTVEVPIWLDSEELSEEQLNAIVAHAIESGELSGEDAKWMITDSESATLYGDPAEPSEPVESSIFTELVE